MGHRAVVPAADPRGVSFLTSPRSRGEVGSHRRCDLGEGDFSTSRTRGGGPSSPTFSPRRAGRRRSKMPLQNRVTPFGDIVAIPDRGCSPATTASSTTPRPDATEQALVNPAWLVCLCEYKGKRREVMSRQSWTELFFLDEATALAAGIGPASTAAARMPTGFAAAGRRATASAVFWRATSMPCCIVSGCCAARSGCTRSKCRSRNCPTARCCRKARKAI